MRQMIQETINLGIMKLKRNKKERIGQMNTKKFQGDA